MKPKKKRIKPSPKAPAKLVKVWRENGENFYKTGKALGINESWVWQLIREGKTPKRLDLQRKLFLTRKRSPEELEVIRLRKRYDREQVQHEIVEYFKKVIGG